MHLIALILLALAFVMRLIELKGEQRDVEKIAADGTSTTTVVTKRVSFYAVITTFFTLPPLAALFAVVEFKKSKAVCTHFKFLEHSLGKGIYLLMTLAVFLENAKAVRVVIAIMLAPIPLIDIFLGVLEIKMAVSAPEKSVEKSPSKSSSKSPNRPDLNLDLVSAGLSNPKHAEEVVELLDNENMVGNTFEVSQFDSQRSQSEKKESIILDSKQQFELKTRSEEKQTKSFSIIKKEASDKNNRKVQFADGDRMYNTEQMQKKPTKTEIS